jgi:hypothetical protein
VRGHLAEPGLLIAADLHLPPFALLLLLLAELAQVLADSLRVLRLGGIALHPLEILRNDLRVALADDLPKKGFRDLMTKWVARVAPALFCLLLDILIVLLLPYALKSLQALHEAQATLHRAFNRRGNLLAILLLIFVQEVVQFPPPLVNLLFGLLGVSVGAPFQLARLIAIQ